MTQTVLLGDIADVLNGAAFSSRDFITKEQASDRDLPVFKMGNLAIGGGLRKGKDDYIPAGKLEKLQRQITQQFDILMCMTDMKSSMNLLGYSGQIKDEKFAVNQRVGIIRPRRNKVNPTFLYYYLNSPDFIQRIRSTANSGVQVNLSTSAIRTAQIDLPSKEEQEFIANTIGTIDEKIELNRQMNETLEQMGQVLFRHYFIDNLEAEKWEDGIISDLGEVITGKTPSKSKTEYYGSDVMFLKVPDMHGQSIVIKTEDNLSVAGADAQPKKYIPKWSTCVSCIATVGVVSLAGDTLQTNQQINSVIPKSEEYAIFNYYLLKSKSELLKTMASGGSATPNLNKGHFEKVSIVLPPDDILKAFHDEARGILEMVYENTRQIQTLTTLRDSLLPRLISGKVKV